MPRIDRAEDGQGLVEYALILALVSLAAVLALGFLSGKINDLFSKSGNSLNTVSVASGAGGGTTPPPGPTPPPDHTPAADFPTSSNAFGKWYNGNGALNNPQGLNGAPTGASGLYSTTDGRSGTCSFTAANGYTFTGTWHPTGSEPGNWEWNATGDGLTGELLSACYGTLGGPGGGEPPTNAPANGTAASSFPTKQQRIRHLVERRHREQQPGRPQRRRERRLGSLHDDRRDGRLVQLHGSQRLHHDRRLAPECRRERQLGLEHRRRRPGHHHLRVCVLLGDGRSRECGRRTGHLDVRLVAIRSKRACTQSHRILCRQGSGGTRGLHRGERGNEKPSS